MLINSNPNIPLNAKSEYNPYERVNKVIQNQIKQLLKIEKLDPEIFEHKKTENNLICKYNKHIFVYDISDYELQSWETETCCSKKQNTITETHIDTIKDDSNNYNSICDEFQNTGNSKDLDQSPSKRFSSPTNSSTSEDSEGSGVCVTFDDFFGSKDI